MASLRENSTVPFDGVPGDLTLHLVPGKFHVVKHDPNTDERLIAWSMPKGLMGMITNGAELKTTLPVEQFAGLNCVAVVLCGSRMQNEEHLAIIGMKNLEDDTLLIEQNPVSLRALSRGHVQGRTSMPLANFYKSKTAGVRFFHLPPAQQMKELVVETLLTLVVLAVVFSLLLLIPSSQGSFSTTFKNEIILVVGFLLYLNRQDIIMSFLGHVYDEKEARTFVRTAIEHIETSGQFQEIAYMLSGGKMTRLPSCVESLAYSTWHRQGL